jgi:hypothetical protein
MKFSTLLEEKRSMTPSLGALFDPVIDISMKYLMLEEQQAHWPYTLKILKIQITSRTTTIVLWQKRTRTCREERETVGR